MVTKFSHQCNFSLFWYTSLACSPDKQAIKAVEDNNNDKSCRISIPIYDQLLDLTALTSKIGYLVDSGKWCKCYKSWIEQF